MVLQGKSAIITGSTSGIGEGIAQALAQAGCNIMLNGFGDAAAIESLRESIEKTHGVQCRYSPADMTRPEQITGMAKEARDAFGQVDILVNNAGIQHVDAVEDFPPEKWDAVIAINLSSAFHGIRAVMPGMKERGWGRIINVASAHGVVASAQKAAYVSSKHGVLGLTKVVGLEVAPLENITCNAICPGWVLTPLVEKQVQAKADAQGISFDEAKIQLLSEKQPSQEFVSVEELGSLAVYLCGDLARSICGTAILMDGGWTAQ